MAKGFHLNRLVYMGVTLALTAVPAYAALNVTVSISGTTDYVGEAALQEAFQDIELAGTDGDNSVVTIEDGGTYLGEIRVTNTNVTLRVAEGTAPVIRGGTNGPTGEATLRIGRKYDDTGGGGSIVVRGDSPANRLVIESEPPDKNALTSTTGKPGVLFENVELRVAAGGEAVWCPISTGSNEAFVNCKVSTPNKGPFLLGGNGSNGLPTFTDCEITGYGAPIFSWGRGAVFTRCSIATGWLIQDGPNENNAGPFNITFNACTFPTKFESLPTSIYAGQTVTFNDCAFGADFSDWKFARVTNGTLNLNGCLWQGGGIDCSSSYASKVTGVGANVNLNRCVVDFSAAANPLQPLIDMDSAAVDSDQPRRVTLTNSIFKGAGTTSSLLNMTMNETTIPAEMTFTHCTFFGPTSNVILDVHDQTATANYCIIDGSQAPAFAIWGGIAGVRNIVANCNPAQPKPSDTITEDPRLSSDGHLLADSPALEAAVGSTTTVDIDGEPRPQPAGSVNKDIGADETALRAPDSVPPVIKLTGDAETYVSFGMPFFCRLGDPFAHPVVVTDNADSNLTGAIVVSGSVDIDTEGTYVLTYNVSDTAGNAATPLTLTVVVTADPIPLPATSLVGLLVAGFALAAMMVAYRSRSA